MSKITFVSAALIAAVAIGAAPANADNHGIAVSGNVTLATDYRFRGVSQTTRDPAIQGGFDVEFASGFALGTWASNVNFGDDTSMELDLYATYTHAINDNSAVSVGYTRFEYPSEGDALDYNEIYGSYSFGDFTFGLVYSNEYLAIDNAEWWYPYFEYGVDLSGVSVAFHVGFNLADEDIFFNDDSYTDWSVTLSKEVAGVELGLAYVDTDINDCGNACDSTVVLSISKSM